jgi:biotin synthase-like enzyme
LTNKMDQTAECWYCGAERRNKKALRTHLRRAHKEILKRKNTTKLILKAGKKKQGLHQKMDELMAQVVQVNEKIQRLTQISNEQC